MSAIEPLCHIVDINSSVFTKEENIFLEAELFICICEELKEIFIKQYKEYFRLIKFTFNKENTMLEIHFIRLIINDILSTQEYTLSGIARYTDTPEDVIEEFFIEYNANPSALFLRRLIELH
jgi:hypothetical protein